MIEWISTPLCEQVNGRGGIENRRESSRSAAAPLILGGDPAPNGVAGRWVERDLSRAVTEHRRAREQGQHDEGLPPRELYASEVD